MSILNWFFGSKETNNKADSGADTYSEEYFKTQAARVKQRKLQKDIEDAKYQEFINQRIQRMDELRSFIIESLKDCEVIPYSEDVEYLAMTETTQIREFLNFIKGYREDFKFSYVENQGNNEYFVILATLK